jgi:V/A-type H+/Na+-transporting ATPase subunit I
MIVTEPMKQLIAVIRDTDADAVTKGLLNAGVLHFIQVSEIERNAHVDAMVPQIPQSRISETRKQVENYLAMLKVVPQVEKGLDAAGIEPLDLGTANRFIDALSLSVQDIRNKQKEIQQDILKLEDLKRQLDMFGDIKAGLYTRSSYSFLTIQTGRILSTRLPDFTKEIAAMPNVQLNFGQDATGTNILLITMKREDRKVNEILDRFGWVDVRLTEGSEEIKENVFADLDAKLARLHSDQDRLLNESYRIVSEKKEELSKMWVHLRTNELYYSIQSYFSRTAKTMLFTGWVPAGSQKALDRIIIAATGGKCYMEWYTPQEMQKMGVKAQDIPVQLKNPKLLSPFQTLVTNWSIPEYGTIDPTPFVAVTYFIMFGLMFGDVCQGFIIGALGLLGSFYFRKRDQGYFQLCNLMIYCGMAAILAGIAFGSYFGFQWFKPLWFNYHGIVFPEAGAEPLAGSVKTIYDILGITIWFGIAVIGLGILFNWVNLISKRKWFHLFFDKCGFLGSFLYFAGVYTAFYYVGHDYKALPDANFLGLFIGIPVLILLAKAPIEFALHRGHNPEKKLTVGTVLNFIMEWVIELLEIFSGYLANTLSFMRVAGLGIAHVSLMVSFRVLAESAGGGAGIFTIQGMIILVAGNALVIALEGFSAGIQSLRLNYYEFFSKYFVGNGKAYAPVSLRNR